MTELAPPQPQPAQWEAPKASSSYGTDLQRASDLYLRNKQDAAHFADGEIIRGAPPKLHAEADHLARVLRLADPKPALASTERHESAKVIDINSQRKRRLGGAVTRLSGLRRAA